MYHPRCYLVGHMILVKLENIQSIESAEIGLNEQGLTEFSGNNSNGKSILSRCIEWTCNGNITNKEKRNQLIRDGCTEGRITFVHGKESIIITLREELKDSAVMYLADVNNTDTGIARSLGDKGYITLLNKFGFRCYFNGDVCLQVAPTYGVIPFVSTSPSANFEIVNDVTKDKVAEEFITTFKTITYPVIRERFKELQTREQTLTTILDNLDTYDWKAYEDIYNRMRAWFDSIASYQDPQPTRWINPIPKFSGVELDTTMTNWINPIPAVDVIPTVPLSNSLLELVENIEKINNRVCPTCGRKLVE